jgi:hypothetical protein
VEGVETVAPVVAAGGFPVVTGGVTTALVVTGELTTAAVVADFVVTAALDTAGVAPLVIEGTFPEVIETEIGGDADPVTTISAHVEYITPFCQSHFHQRV